MALDRKHKILLVAVFILLAVSVALAYRVSTQREQAFKTHYEKAYQAEKSGDYDMAIKEFKEALKYVARNDDDKKKEVQEKIEEVTKKAEEKKSQTSSGAQGNSGGTSEEEENQQQTGENAVGETTPPPVQGPENTGVKDLSVLLPSTFLELRGDVSKGDNLSSIRFDDVASRTMYVVYVYKLENAQASASFAQRTRDTLYSQNKLEIPLSGEYNGYKGFYGENERGELALYFSYGDLAFELLTRSEYLDRDKLKENLFKLQEAIKKP